MTASTDVTPESGNSPSNLALEEGKDAAVLTYVFMIGVYLFAPLILVALVVSYVNRKRVKGHWLYRHFTWQINTIWYTLLYSLIALIVIVPSLFMSAEEGVLRVLPGVVGIGILFLTGLWYAYRTFFGAYRLYRKKPPKLLSAHSSG